MRTPEISRIVFGGVLNRDASGFYPGLELFNYLFGAEESGILTQEAFPEFTRRSQDFARRLVWDFDRFSQDNEGEKVFIGESAEETLRHLLSCLQLQVPNRKTKNWEAAHFFPYTRSLIHWDARRRRNTLMIERRYFRGGGAMAHKVLRMDPDKDRLEVIRKGFSELLPDNSTAPLERLAKVLGNKAIAPVVSDDRKIEAAVPVDDTDGLNNLYRNGVRNILSHTDLSTTSRIQSIVSWTGFWLLLCQHRRAATYMDENERHLLIDCGNGPSQIRRDSSRNLKDILSLIIRSAVLCAEKHDKAEPTAKDKQQLSGFFTGTSAWIGLLNSFSGKRHFVIKLDLLETLVLATTEPDQEVEFEYFIFSILYKQFGLVIGRSAASEALLLHKLDASIFEDNEESFANQLSAAGLMHDYSDSTRMISARAIK